MSRSGVYGGWPEIAGSLGPMARTVRDLAILLDSMVGYDAEDPLTARGVGHVSSSYTKFLDKNGLKGARIGVLRESMGYESELDSEDFNKVTEVFDNAVAELKAAGAEVGEPHCHPQAQRAAREEVGKPDRRRRIVQNIFRQERQSAIQISSGVSPSA